MPRSIRLYVYDDMYLCVRFLLAVVLDFFIDDTRVDIENVTVLGDDVGLMLTKTGPYCRRFRPLFEATSGDASLLSLFPSRHHRWTISTTIHSDIHVHG